METGTLACGTAASARTTPVMQPAAPVAAGMSSGERGGTAKQRTHAARPAEHTRGNRGPATTFATGATSGSWENIAADSGVAMTLEANVRESPSATTRGTRGAADSTHDAISPANSTIPSVERAESAKETESAVVGESETHPMMQTERAPSAAGRRRAANESIPATAMTAARTADTGAPDSTR